MFRVVDGNFQTVYRELEGRMKALAEADGDVFLPNPEPECPVQYVLICMEPSLGRWARRADKAMLKVQSGFRNFLPSDEVALLHFCIRRYLCRTAERYYITDLSKGAMLVQRAGDERATRYERWFPLLEEEIALVAAQDACIIAVGNAVAQQLKRQGFQRHFTPIIHYSSQAGLARREGIVGHETSFKAFGDSVSLDDVVATAKDVLASARVPPTILEETLSKLRRFQLTTSRQQLMFTYKRVFESLAKP
jgi:hypothetical protein